MIPGHHPFSRRSMGRLGILLLLLSTGVAPAQTIRTSDAYAPVASRTTPEGVRSRTRGDAPAPDGPRMAKDSGVVHAAGETNGTSSGGVVQAGANVVSAKCRHCGRRGCDHCRGAGGRGGLHCNGRCDAGGCPAHCPVRPEQFGFYATRWRNWPGQGVKQVAHFDPATTPAIPPRSQVPTLEEESNIGPNEPLEELPEDLDEKPDAGDMPSDAAPAGDAAAPRGSADSEKGDRDDEGAGDDAVPMDDGDSEAIDSGDGARAPTRSRGRAAEPVGGTVGAPGRNETSRRAPQAPRVARPETSELANPLRKKDFQARPASGTTAGASASFPASSQAAKSPRREAEEGQWRPSRRSTPAGEIAAPLMRGVTANPGNPLR